MKRGISALAGALVLMLGLTGPAFAGKDGYGSIQAPIKDVPSPPFMTAQSYSLKCPPRWPYALAGGYSFRILYEGGPQPSSGVAIENFPNGTRVWTLRTFNYDPSVGGSSPRLGSMCAKRDPEFRVRHRTVNVAPGATTGVVAKCGRKEDVVSAGWLIGNYAPVGGSEILVAESRRLDERRWRATGVNLGDADGPLELVINCSKRTPPLRESSAVVPLESGRQSSVTPECRKGRAAYSYGFDAIDDAGNAVGYGYGSYPYPGGSGWNVDVAGLDGLTAGVTATTYGYCGSYNIDH